MLSKACRLGASGCGGGGGGGRLSSSSSSSFVGLLTLQQRTWFDYVKYANGVDTGKSIEEMEEQDAVAATKQSSDRFSWSFIDWFQKHKPERVGEWSSLKSQYSLFENYLRSAGGASSSSESASTGKDIPFAEFRNKIADPKFVDELEIDYHVQKNALQSITDMNVLQNWNSKHIDAFEQELQKSNDLIWKPLTEAQKLEMLNRTKAAEQEDAKQKLMGEELQKDYEQLDAERMLLDYGTMQMNLSQNPRFAEATEDAYQARQFVYDYFIDANHLNQFKKMRLKQFQDANRRKLFLERFELVAKLEHE